jgi:hypothetical protein
MGLRNCLPEEMESWLNWSGQIFLSMQIRDPGPQGFRVAWPVFAQKFYDAYGATNERVRPPRPSAEAISLMDQIMQWPNLLPDETARIVIYKRSLVTPLSERHLFTWTKLAVMLRTDRRKVARIYDKGIAELCRSVERRQVYMVRKTLPDLL